MIEKILELASRVAQDAEVFEVESEETPVQFENNKLKSASTRSVKGYALRIIKDGKIGFSSTTKPDAAEDLVRFAVETAEFGQKAVFELPSQPESLPKINLYDAAVANLTVEELVATGQEIVDAIKQAEPDAQCSVEVEKAIGRRRLVNTQGLDVTYTATYYGMGGGMEVIRGTDMLQVWDGRDSRSKLEAAEVASKIIAMAKLGRNVVPIDTREMPVLFTPKGFAMTFDMPLLMAFNGKEVLQGATPVSDKLGKQEFDPRVSIYDDATQDFSTGARPFDDEGVPTSRMPLVEKGVVKNFIYDLESAAKAGKSPTGNGQRGLSSLPNPNYNAIIFEPGDASLEEMIKGVKYGLLIDQTLGAWSGNVRGGSISGNVHFGIKIENGELVGRVKDVMVSGNVFEAFKRIDAIENKCHPMHSGLCIPHILFSNLSIATQ
ncbi:MAG TPA: TldD/PmbA family protein [Armatimonadota bacterium]|nr:TldD/PmbA family protein [Armatimonadota bacterium]